MEGIDKLVAEFFIIRSKPNPGIRVSSSNLLSSLQLQDSSSDDSLNLKVSSVLRDISDSLIQSTISEETLDRLENVKKLLQQQQQERIGESNVRFKFNDISFITQRHNKEECASSAPCSSLESIAEKMLKASDPEIGDITVCREMKDHLLKIQGYIEKEPNNVTRDGQDHSAEIPSEKGSGSQGTSSSSSPRGVRAFRLPTHIPFNVSTSKKAVAKRTRRFWTYEEEEALKEGVENYGKSWKDIKDAYPIIFAKRTPVDLKDKWRNLLKRY